MDVYRFSRNVKPVSNILDIMFDYFSTSYSQYCLLLKISGNRCVLPILAPRSSPNNPPITTSSTHKYLSSQLFSAHLRYLELVIHN